MVDKKLIGFALAMYARSLDKSSRVDIRVMVGFTKTAHTTAEAVGQGIACIQEAYPRDIGWYDHQCIATEVYDD